MRLHPRHPMSRRPSAPAMHQVPAQASRQTHHRWNLATADCRWPALEFLGGCCHLCPRKDVAVYDCHCHCDCRCQAPPWLMTMAAGGVWWVQVGRDRMCRWLPQDVQRVHVASAAAAHRGLSQASTTPNIKMKNASGSGFCVSEN